MHSRARKEPVKKEKAEKVTKRKSSKKSSSSSDSDSDKSGKKKKIERVKSLVRDRGDKKEKKPERKDRLGKDKDGKDKDKGKESKEKQRSGGPAEVGRDIGELLFSKELSDIELIVTEPAEKTKEPKSGSRSPSRSPSRGLSAAAAAAATDAKVESKSESRTERFPAHKLVLAVRSGKFKSLLFGPEAKATATELKIEDLSIANFKMLMKFVYHGKVHLEPHEISGATEIAKRYDVPGLKVYCGSFLVNTLNVDNALDLFETAPSIIGDPLWGLPFVCENAAELITKPAFLRLSKDRMKVLLAADALAVPSECELFIEVVKWAEAEAKRLKLEGADGVKKAVEELIPLIRFPQMDMSELATVVAPSNLVDGDQLLALFTYVSLDESARSESKMTTFNTKPRSSGFGPGIMGDWDTAQSFTHNVYDASNKGRTLTKARTNNIYVCRTKKAEKKQPDEFVWRLRVDQGGATDTYARIGLAMDNADHGCAWITNQGTFAFHPNGSPVCADGTTVTGSVPSALSPGTVVTFKVNKKKGEVKIHVSDKGKPPGDKDWATFNWPSLSSRPDGYVYGAVCVRALNWQFTQL